MKNRLLWLFLALFLFAALLVGRIWFWKSSVTVEANVPFTAVFRAAKEVTGTSFSCLENSCSWKLRPGKYELSIAADGYFPQREETELAWRRHNSFQIDLQKIPVLKPLASEPDSWKEYESGRKELEGQFHLDASGKLFRRAGAADGLVAEFPAEEASVLRIFPESTERLFLLSPRHLYEVDVAERRKFLIYTAPEEEVLTDLLVLSKSELLVKSRTVEAERTFFFSTGNRSVRSFPENIAFRLTCRSLQEEPTLFFLIQEGQWVLKKFDLGKNEVSGVAGYDFEEAPERILCLMENAVMIKTAQKFYELDFSS